jgi:mitochondrial fission protein ELM1
MISPDGKPPIADAPHPTGSPLCDVERKLPRIWLLLGDKPGDNAQARAIAAATATRCPVEVKSLHFKKKYRQARPLFRPILHHLDLDRSDSLVEPWPDPILTTGRRPALAALWVKHRSGGRAKLVIMGRPHRHLDSFDLVIAPPQFRLPNPPKILQLQRPISVRNISGSSSSTSR